MSSYTLFFLFALFFIFLILFSTECLAQIDFSTSIGLVLPFFTNYQPDVLNSILFTVTFDVIYHLSDKFFIGLYLENMMGIVALLDAIEATFWILLFPISIPLALTGCWPFPDFHESAILISTGGLIGIVLIDKEEFDLNFFIRLGIGPYMDNLTNYEGDLAIDIEPNIVFNYLINRRFKIGITVAFNYLYIFNESLAIKYRYFPAINVCFSFS